MSVLYFVSSSLDSPLPPLVAHLLRLAGGPVDVADLEHVRPGLVAAALPNSLVRNPDSIGMNFGSNIGFKNGMRFQLYSVTYLNYTRKCSGYNVRLLKISVVNPQ